MQIVVYLVHYKRPQLLYMGIFVTTFFVRQITYVGKKLGEKFYS